MPEEAESAITLRSLAAEVVKRHKEPQAARKVLLTKIESDKTLLESLLGRIIEDAIASAIYCARHTESRDVRFGSLPRSVEGIAGAAELMASSFLKRWTMPDGRSLAEWKGSELPDEAERNEGEAKGYSDKARFYRELAKKCGNRKIENAIGSGQALMLFKAIQGETGVNQTTAVA